MTPCSCFQEVSLHWSYAVPVYLGDLFVYHFQAPKVDWGWGHPGMGSFCLLQLVHGMYQLLGSDWVFQFLECIEKALCPVVGLMSECRCVG